VYVTVVVPSLTQTGLSPVITGAGNGLMVTVIVQVDVVHPLVTVHVIVETPILKLPLASFPVPVLLVAPVIVKVIVIGLPQLSDAERAGIT